MLISVILDVPDLFRPKAEFAIQTMFSAFFVDVCFYKNSDINPSKEKTTIYYGCNADKFLNKSHICFQATLETILYFEQFTPYELSGIHQVEQGEHAFAVLFGNRHYHQNCYHSDIFASAFFFLSDWQKMINEKDEHGRSQYSKSVQYYLNAAMRPLVNEYTDWLMELISTETGLSAERKKWSGHNFAALITHDFDRIKKRYIGTYAREFVEIPFFNALNMPLKKRMQRLRLAIEDMLAAEDGYEKSIKNQFQFEKEKGIRPTVLLKSIIKKHARDARDYLDYPFLDEIIAKITELNGEIGYHASYCAGYDKQLLEQELCQLKKRLNRDIHSHRFHYLRYEPCYGLQLLEENEIKTDSSVGWAEQSGYRTSFIFPHFIFDIRNNRVTSLVEVPMTLMDMQVFQYMDMNISEAVMCAKKQVDLAEKYGGIVVWNFHHHTLDKSETGDCDILFENSLNYLHSKKPLYLTMGEIYDAFQIK